MKHLLVLIVLLCIAYGAWNLIPKSGREEGLRRISHHGLRLGALVLVIVALLALAYYVPSINIL
jgi:hypothetical protein